MRCLAKSCLVLSLAAASSSVEAENSVVHAQAPYLEEARAAARAYTLPVPLILAVIHAESAFNPRAVSRKGARGLMQLMPSTARWLQPGIRIGELFDARTNIDLGSRYLRYLANRYAGHTRTVLAAYNWGPGKVDAKNSLPGETRQFIRRVANLYPRYVSRLVK